MLKIKSSILFLFCFFTLCWKDFYSFYRRWPLLSHDGKCGQLFLLLLCTSSIYSASPNLFFWADPTSNFFLMQLVKQKKRNNFQGDPRVPYKIGGANPRSSIEKRRAKRFNWKSTTLRVQPDHFIICISTNYLSLQHSKESFHPIQLLILEQSWKTRISYTANPLLLPYLSYPSILAMAMECNLKKPLLGVKWSHHLSFPNFILLPFPTLRGS